MRTCSFCKNPFEPRTPRQRFCWYGPCRDRRLGRKRVKPPGATVASGYGYRFKKLREQWKPLVDRGEVDCHDPECGRPIVPGTPWDLGHDPHDRSIIRGPEHARCNRSNGAKQGNTRRGQGRVFSSRPRIV